MKLIEMIKWLLNHPPVGITNNVPNGTVCDYCGSKNILWLDDCGCICQRCRKKAFDKILGKPKKKC